MSIVEEIPVVREAQTWVARASQDELRQIAFNLAYRLAYIKRAVNGGELPTALDNDETIFEEVSNEAWSEIYHTPI